VESQALQDSVESGASDLLHTTVFMSFRHDDISQAAKRDSPIVDIGNLRMKNVGLEIYASVANRMRSAPRLHLRSRELDNHPKGVVVDWINPKSCFLKLPGMSTTLI